MGIYRLTAKNGAVKGYVSATNDVDANRVFKAKNGKGAFHVERVSKRSELTGKVVLAENPTPSPFREVAVGMTTNVRNI